LGLKRFTPKYMYARTDRCYNERGSRTNYVRSDILHCIYKRNIKEGSYNHCCRGKAMSITYYSKCVSVVLVIHSMKSACAILSSLACPAVSYFSTLCHNWHDFREKKVTGYKRRVLNFLLTNKCTS